MCAIYFARSLSALYSLFLEERCASSCLPLETNSDYVSVKVRVTKHVCGRDKRPCLIAILICNYIIVFDKRRRN